MPRTISRTWTPASASRRLVVTSPDQLFDVVITEQEELKLALAETGSVMRQLHSITTSQGLPLQDRLHWILKTGCEHFGLPNGIVSHVHDDQYEVLAAHSPNRRINVGDVFPLGMTFCSETLEFGGAVHFEDASKTRFRSHPCYLDMGLATYIGIPIEVDGIGYVRSQRPEAGSPLPRTGITVSLEAPW